MASVWRRVHRCTSDGRNTRNGSNNLSLISQKRGVDQWKQKDQAAIPACEEPGKRQLGLMKDIKQLEAKALDNRRHLSAREGRHKKRPIKTP
jgi:hypothetical protein